MQGNESNAISYLERLDKIEKSDTSDSSILAKSSLHLGRLYYNVKTYELSHQSLEKCYKKSKNQDKKELFDIAKINLGMIIGLMDKESFINKIKDESYEQFLIEKNNFCQIK